MTSSWAADSKFLQSFLGIYPKQNQVLTGTKEEQRSTSNSSDCSIQASDFSARYSPHSLRDIQEYLPPLSSFPKLSPAIFMRWSNSLKAESGKEFPETMPWSTPPWNERLSPLSPPECPKSTATFEGGSWVSSSGMITRNFEAVVTGDLVLEKTDSCSRTKFFFWRKWKDHPCWCHIGCPTWLGGKGSRNRNFWQEKHRGQKRIPNSMPFHRGFPV